jgi:GST-like protein
MQVNKDHQMIQLYTWSTPNGRKISIALEELGLTYQVHPINIGKDEQFSPEFLAVAPNNKIPAIVDEDTPGGALSIFESGAILTYLAEKTGRLLATAGPQRFKALEWLHWQMGGLGPMLGQLGFFALRAPEKSAVAIERFTTESGRLLGVMEKRLGEVPYLAGEDYSIADIACYPWTFAARTFLKDALAAQWQDKPAITAWLDRVGARPAVQRGMAVPKT